MAGKINKLQRSKSAEEMLRGVLSAVDLAGFVGVMYGADGAAYPVAFGVDRGAMALASVMIGQCSTEEDESGEEAEEEHRLDS